MARYNPNDYSQVSLQCLSFTDHAIFKGGYSSVWRSGMKAKKPSCVVVYKPNDDGQLVRAYVVDSRTKKLSA